MMFWPRTVVLMYHRIASVRFDRWSLCVSPEHFAEHLEVLQKYRRMRLDRLGPHRWLRKPGLTVAITFDDGYADNLYEGARLLKQFDTPATFFITTGYIGSDREFWWDELERAVPGEDFGTHYETLQPLRHEIRRRILDDLRARSGQSPVLRPSHRPMNHDELLRLAGEDLFEIGAHTVTHPLLAAQPADEQYDEIRRSKLWLEEFLDRPVTSFSYPFGGKHHYTRTTVNAVREAGFTRACTTESRTIARSDSAWEVPRIQVPDIDGDAFQQLLFA